MGMKVTMAEFVGLEPCPFCGGKAYIVDHHNDDGSVSVGCTNDTCLGFSGLGWLYKTEAEAIIAWNTRAELGSGTLTAEQVCKAVYAHSIHADCADADWQAIADELNAELGSGTCKRMLYKPTGVLVCSECGAGMPKQLDKYCYLHFCPNCGRKVVNDAR